MCYHVQNLHLEQLNAESVSNVQGIMSLCKTVAGVVSEIKALGCPMLLLYQNMLALYVDSVLGDYAGPMSQIMYHFQKVGM